ncbi:IclR family transcriptional regulator [Actinomadura sp. NBRC 104425]|uniref:IclR family transcriptional regulator n=1 Tax=Actinomadura sp. NBRC 104425 TaxID=3032204 RepID=UPI0024A2CE73|nr:IclR family transcriptional regulator [Actinomadura sp. NBRC 104425]GLZ11605.1 IclR family transcriptional regulator [Actinomadura sp. NBRC 104425]
MTDRPRAPVSAGLRRDLEILELLARPEHASGGLGVSRIAELLGREKSQVSRALKALESEGMADRDPESLEYRLGWRLYALAARTAEARLTHLAAPYLRRLVAALNETTHLCVLRGSGVLTLLSVSPTHAFRGLGWEGVTVPVPMTSAGRVLLSDWAPDTLRAWMASWLKESPMPGHPRQRPPDIDYLLREIAMIRKRGFAAVDEEFEPGLVGVSAPIRDFRGGIIAAINVSAPKGRLGGHLDEAGRRTLAVARELSAKLGYHPETRPH